MKTNANKVKTQIASLVENNRLLTKAFARTARDLARYGRHDMDCPATAMSLANDKTCTCGYSAALNVAPELI